MSVKDDFKKLWEPENLPERIRDGNFAIYAEEKEILEGYVKELYKEADEKGVISAEDYAMFVELIDTLYRTDDEELLGIVDQAMILNAKLRNRYE